MNTYTVDITINGRNYSTMVCSTGSENMMQEALDSLGVTLEIGKRYSIAMNFELLYKD